MTNDLAIRAAAAALHQRRHGERASLRELYSRSFSLLRFLHNHWTATADIPA